MDPAPASLFFVFLTMVAGVMLLVAIVAFMLIVRPWLRAFLHGTPVSLLRIVAMRLRGNPPWLLIDAYGTLKRAGSNVTMSDVEIAYIDARNQILTSDDLVELIERKATAR